MPKHIHRKTPLKTVKASLLPFAFLGAFSALTVPVGARIDITPVTRLSVLGTDNVALSSDDEESDVVGQVTQIVNISRETRRSEFFVFAASSYDTYLDRSEFNDFRHQVNARGEVQALDDLFFIEVVGVINEETIDEDIAQPALPRSVDNERQRQFTGLVSPYVVFRPARGIETEVRGRVSGTTYEAVGNTDEDDLNEDTSSVGGLVELRSPGEEQGLRWSALFDYDKSDDDDEQLTWLGSVSVPVRADLRLLARAGYETIDSSDVDEDTEDNPIWTVGFEYNPDQRIELRAEAGQRFGDDFYQAEADFALAPAFNLRARYTVEFVRDEDIALQGVEDFDFDNPEQIVLGDGNVQDGDASSIEEQARIEVFGTRGLTSYRIGASYRERDFEASDQIDETTTFDATIARQINRVLTASLTGGYATTDDTGSIDDTDVYFGIVGFDYLVSRDVTAGIRYAYRQQEFELLDTISENAALVQVSKEW
ncbi:MAG: TIGR03016 family PEP-CTERM system-associated outer membrane protein [Pseudomonadota bacterium]